MPGSTRPPIAGVAIVLVAASLFGMLGPLSRFAYDAGMEPLALVAWRGGIGFLATAAFIGIRLVGGTRAAALILQRAAPPGERIVTAPAVEAEAPASDPAPSTLPLRSSEG